MYWNNNFKACEGQDFDGVVPFDPNRVYSEQLHFREIILNGEINNTLLEKCIIPIINYNRYDDEMEEQANAKLKEPYVREPIRILINSPGGIISDCMGLVGVIKSSKTPIHTIVTGQACSAGFLILIAGHKRFAYEHSSMMIHPGSGGYIGSFPSIIKHAEHVLELQTRVNTYIHERTFVSLEDLEEMCEHEYDWYMYSDEALCRGVVDGIIVGQNIIDFDMYVAIQKEQEKAAKAEKKKAVTKPKKTKEVKNATK